jgi:YebC/PmpR family DNA-binding regulatory protein
MSGHNKWSTIKHKKGANDAKRGKILTKYSKILSVVGRNDPNPETNSTLRTAIANAKSENVPNDNIERILKRLAGEGKEGAIYSEQVYEGFGPAGIPFVVTALTDNSNRTYPSVKLAFVKNGGNLGNSGSVMFHFNHVGVISIKNKGKSEDELFEMVIEAGGDDFLFDEAGESEIITKFEQLGAVRSSIMSAGLEVVKSAPEYHAKDPVKITDAATLEKVEKFIAAVEDAEDVDDVFGGFEVDDSLC